MNDKDLLEYIQRLGLTNEEFAKYIDVSYDTLKTWLYRNKEVPKKKAEFVMNKIKLHHNYTILETEKTLQKKDEISGDLKEKYKIIENPEDIPEQFRKWVKPFYPDMKVGAGMNNGSFPVATKYFILVPFSENVEFWIPVEGKSMIPRYNHGDLVGVSEMHFDGVFSRENYVVLLNSNSWHLKQVELTDEDFVWLNSYNVENPPKKMNLDKISKFFKVRMFIGNE